MKLHADTWGRSLFGKLEATLAGGMRQRVTRAGVGFSVTIALVAVLAFVTANNLLFLILSCLLAALLISGFLNRLSLAGLALDLVFPEHVCARRKTHARLRIHNEKTWMPSFSIHVAGTQGNVFSSEHYFPVIPRRETLEEPVVLYFARRGTHTENSFQLRSRFPFGFSERRIQVTLRRDVLVYPALDPQPGVETLLRQLQGEIEAQIRGRGHDFYRIRPYEPLESARNVDWRATAHTGELQVREFSQQQDALIDVYLDLAVTEPHVEWFERAVDCCAWLVWETAARGTRIRFRTMELDVTIPTEADTYTILEYLALVEPRQPKGVPEPASEECIQVLFSAEPGALAHAGWSRAHWVGPDRLPPTNAPGSATRRTAARPEFDNGR
jgi:uncharacterized protein (DUF58 family)